MKRELNSKDELQKLFEKEGLRNTSQRRAVYDYLCQTDSHPTARQIYQKLKPDHPTLSLATVYNTLDLLVALRHMPYLGARNTAARRHHISANVSLFFGGLVHAHQPVVDASRVRRRLRMRRHRNRRMCLCSHKTHPQQGKQGSTGARP